MQQTTRQLRPMAAGELFQEALELYRENVTLFVGIVLIPILIETVLNILIVASSSGGSGSVILSILTSVVTVALSLLTAGALSVAVASRYLGRPITVGQAYSSIGADVLWILFLASLLDGLIVGIGFLLLVIPGIYLLVRFIFVPQMVVLERTGVFQAFSRSGQLVSGSWWRVFGIGVLLLLLISLAGVVVGAILGALLFVGGAGGSAIRAIVSGVVAVILRPYAYTAIILLYFDLRLRKEDLNMSSILPPTPGF